MLRYEYEYIADKYCKTLILGNQHPVIIAITVKQGPAVLTSNETEKCINGASKSPGRYFHTCLTSSQKHSTVLYYSKYNKYGCWQRKRRSDDPSKTIVRSSPFPE